MTKRFSIATGVLAMTAALLAVLLVIAAPAFAHHRDGHDQGKDQSQSQERDNDGDADSDSGTSKTEDDDGNDGNTPNNVSDEGDNKHPSGKDRSVENGGSGNQGNSESDPDDDGRGPDRSNGGPDKPDGTGGDDLADQDGNNGCGNDDDFEDDNEGWCGKPDRPEADVAGDVIEDDKTCEEIMGSQELCEPTPPEVEEDTETLPPNVLGDILERGEADVADARIERPAARAAGKVLPFTGSNLIVLLVIAATLLVTGLMLARTRRT